MKYYLPVFLIVLLALTGCVSSADYDRQRFFTVVAAGDTVHPINEGYLDEFIALGREIYAPTRDLISSGDLSFVNIEGPFMDDKRYIEKGGIVFANYPSDLDNLLWAGFNCFSLANNHSFDCGVAGVQNTLDLLDKKKSEPVHKNIMYAGLGRTPHEAVKFSVAVINNVRVAFFAYTARYNRPGRFCNDYSLKRGTDDLALAEGAQLKIVSVHHGEEFRHVPSADVVNNYRGLIDAGADLVLGHHPHVAQGVEKYGRGFIFYSLGNYAMGTVSKRHIKFNGRLYSMIVRVRYIKTGKSLYPESVEIFPLYSDNTQELVVGGNLLRRRRFVPEVLTGLFAQHVLESIELWSGQIPGNRTQFARKGDVLTVKL